MPLYSQDLTDSNDYQIMIGSVHHKIHLGNAYICNGATELGHNHDLDLCFETGSAQAHFKMTLMSYKKSELKIYESPTLTIGTSKNIYNMNRASSNTSAATVKDVSDITSTGTLLYDVLVGDKEDGTNNLIMDKEFVLKENTKYLINIKSLKGGNNLSYSIEWYE